MTVANQSTIDKTLEIHSINNRNKIITLIMMIRKMLINITIII